MSNWNADSVFSIISDLELSSNFEIPLNEARIIVIDLSSFNVYTEYPDNLALKKEELISIIRQDLTHFYSTFGCSQTKVRICFYGSAMAADEHVNFIKEALFQGLGPDCDSKTSSQEKAVKSQESTKTCDTISSTSLETDDSSENRVVKKPRNKIFKTLISIKKQQRNNLHFLKKLQKKIEDLDGKVEKMTANISSKLGKKPSSDQKDLAINSAVDLPGTSGQSINVSLDLDNFQFISAKAAESYFEKKIVKLRDSIPWIKSIRTLRIASIEIEKMRKLRSIIICGPIKYGRFINKIFLRLFGAEKMKATLMVKHSKRHCLRPGLDRSKVFSVKEEKTLKNLLLHVDNNFFSKSQVWEELVRKKANQFGRDLNKRLCDISDSEQDLVSSIQDSDSE